jgi:predicted nucleic acid-binding protein
MKKKLKIYLDTSVINFLFADDAPEKKEITIEFFEYFLDKYDTYISDLVLLEINRTKNINKRRKLLEIIQDYNIPIYDVITNEIMELSKQFILSGIIPEKKKDDSIHVAFATYYEFEILLSWNFRHLANINKQILINSINSQLGYSKQLLL